MAGSNTHYAKAILGMNSKDFKRGVKSANKAWTGFSSGLMRSIGPMAAALGAAGLAKAIISTGATFEQQMANIKAVTRSTVDEMQTMEAAAREIQQMHYFAEKGDMLTRSLTKSKVFIKY